MKKLFGGSMVLLLGMTGCGWWGTPAANQESHEIERIEAGKEQLKEKINIDMSNLFVAEVSKQKGASIYFRINKAKSGFEVKDNVSGTPARTSSDIDHYLVYLVKNADTTGYPSGGDPLGASDLVAGPFTITNTAPVTSQDVRFDNIPSAGGQAYYVAVRAQDASNNDLIQDNNGGTAWTGTTASTPKLAVSTGGGIVVNASLQVSSTTPLSISPNLEDAVGAVLEADVTAVDGDAIPAISATGF